MYQSKRLMKRYSKTDTYLSFPNSNQKNQRPEYYIVQSSEVQAEFESLEKAKKMIIQ